MRATMELARVAVGELHRNVGVCVCKDVSRIDWWYLIGLKSPVRLQKFAGRVSCSLGQRGARSTRGNGSERSTRRDDC